MKDRLAAHEMDNVVVLKQSDCTPIDADNECLLYQGDTEKFLDSLPETPLFDLVITSPPYNIGKPYEKTVELQDYLQWQKRIIGKIASRLKPTGSICWQVGNYVSSNGSEKGRIYPLDYLFAPVFEQLNLILRNRIVWHFGHGLHCKYRFSGRYEVVLWYTKSDEYTFNLDEVRVPSKYPGKRHYKGPNIGKLSGHPLVLLPRPLHAALGHACRTEARR